MVGDRQTNMEHQWNDTDGKPKYSDKNLSQCQFVHHKSHMDPLAYNLGLWGERTATNHLSHGMAQDTYLK